MAERKLYEIAADIRRNWARVYFGAEPYLDAMHHMGSINDSYGEDSGKMIVGYFLCNANGWRGPEARRIKLELNAMLKARAAA